MSYFFLTTSAQDPCLHEIVPHFLYSQTTPARLRNTRDIVVFLDGFFTNLTALRKDLQANDLSAEELLAELYIKGRGFSKVNGHFSAVIVDRYRSELLAITDRNCVGEVYYCVGKDNNIILTSQFERLLPYSAKRLNEYALSCFFCLGDIERQDTLVEDIKRITQFYTLHFDGHLTITDDYLGTVSAIPVDYARPRQDVLENLERLLRSYIENVINENGVLCNTLSGGVDSSYLQALLLERGQAHSFSIGFDTYGRDNAYATDVAQYLGTIHEEVTFSGDEFLTYVERGIKISGKPYMYQGEAMFLKLYEHIAGRCPNKIIVSGQTADAALDSGLPRPVRIALQCSHVPTQLLDLILGCIRNEWRDLGAHLKTKEISSGAIRRIERRSGTCKRVEQYLGFSHDVFVHMAEMANLFPGSKEDKLAKVHLYASEQRRIPNMLAALAGSVGLRILFPFLDPAFLEYVLTIPTRLKRRKYLGKKLAEKHISRKYVYRPKIDKGVPYGKLFREEEHFLEVLKAIKRAGYFRFDVDEMIRNSEYDLLLRLINFHLWKRRVLETP